MKKNYFLLCALLFTAVSFGQVEIFNVAGGGVLPTGWTSDNADTSYEIDRGSYYLVDTDGTNYDIITTDVYDLAGAASATFTLDVATFGSGTNNPAKIEISYDGGSTYTQTETSATATSSTYIDGGTINLSSITNQVRIRISNNGTDNKGVRLRNLILTAYTSDPLVSIDSPTDFQVYSSGTTDVDVVFSTLNTNAGDYVSMSVKTNGGSAVITSSATSPHNIVTSDGDSYEVTATLYDSGNNQLDFETIDFSVSYPCDLVVEQATTSCDAVTGGTDTFTTSIDFTSGGTSTYTITTEGNVGTVGGDDPSSMAAGTITITGVDEGTNFQVYIIGDAGSSSCDLTRNVTGAVCVSLSCPSEGSIIFTEIMQNPNNGANDPNGEYFELYNTTGSSIVLDGWIIKDDLTGSESHTITSLTIPANNYVVIGNVATTTPSLDYNYGNDISLGNSADGVILECSSTTIDAVIWDGGSTFPDPTGASMELSTNKMNSADNDIGTNWSEGTTDIGNGDLGSPGTTNDFTLAIGKNEIDGFAVYPNPIKDGSFKIMSANRSMKSIQLFDMLGKRVLQKEVQSNQDINVDRLNAGIYILKVEEEGKIATRKLVIE